MISQEEFARMGGGLDRYHLLSEQLLNDYIGGHISHNEYRERLEELSRYVEEDF